MASVEQHKDGRARPLGTDQVSDRVGFVMERMGALCDSDRSFDLVYWQRLGDAAIYEAAWELAELYHRSQGMSDDELRLQRSVEAFQRP